MVRIIFLFKAKTIPISYFSPIDAAIYHCDHFVVLL